MEKQYFLCVNGERVVVTREVYSAYWRPVWREAKRHEADQEKGTVHYSNLDTDETNGEDLIFDPTLPSVEDMVEDSALLEKLRKCLLTLKPEEQWLVWELFYSRKSERIIAAEADVSQRTINRRRNRLLKKIKTFLKS